MTLHVSNPLPAGVYWVGDPGYMLDCVYDEGAQEAWEAWLKSTEQRPGLIMDGFVDSFRRYVAAPTMHGDSIYYSVGNRDDHPVDSGLLGVVRADYYAQDGDEPFGMYLEEFPEEFFVSYDDETGVVTIGHLVIPTDR